MSNGNPKPKSYHFPTPVVIRCNSKMTVMAGKATLIHEGDLLITIVDGGQMVELKPLERIEATDSIQTELVVEIEKRPLETLIPNDYAFFFRTEASRASYGNETGIYEYYRREKDASYILTVKRGDKIGRPYRLGSLFEQNSKISIALKAFTREKPFYRRDLKLNFMPATLKSGRLIKAGLDILTREGFLTVQKVPIGEQELERYTRTAKMLP